MHGLPKRLMTKADFDNIQKAVQKEEIPADEAVSRLQALIDTQDKYVFDRLLSADEVADGPEPDYRVVEDERDGISERVQFKRIGDTDCAMSRLGYTQAEVEAKITVLEAI